MALDCSLATLNKTSLSFRIYQVAVDIFENLPYNRCINLRIISLFAVVWRNINKVAESIAQLMSEVGLPELLGYLLAVHDIVTSHLEEVASTLKKLPHRPSKNCRGPLPHDLQPVLYKLLGESIAIYDAIIILNDQLLALKAAKADPSLVVICNFIDVLVTAIGTVSTSSRIKKLSVLIIIRRFYFSGIKGLCRCGNCRHVTFNDLNYGGQSSLVGQIYIENWFLLMYKIHSSREILCVCIFMPLCMQLISLV